MAKGTPPVDEERLPWLEPYREVTTKKRKGARRSHGGLLAGAGAFAVLIAAAGGFWFSQSGDKAPQPTPTRMAEAPPNPAPVAPSPPAAPAPVTPAPVAPAPAVEAPSEGKTTTFAAPAPKRVAATSAKTARKPVRRAVRQPKIRNAGIESARIREVREAQERMPATRPEAPANVRPWPKMPSPGPAGQVIQLGAFSTPARAYAAYRTRLARYPMLGSMPRVVVPVVTKPRGRVLYVLRLGTTSRQQSSIVCRNLRTSGDHCIVIG